jgi:nitroreductase
MAAPLVEREFMNVAEAVQTRRSIRSFSKESVALETIKRVLETARWTPSGCNFQPWEATILTGEPLEALQQVLLQSKFDEPLEYDFSAPGQLEKYQGRLRRVGSAMYGAMGIEREDDETRANFAKSNCLSFGAPILLLCHFPKLMKEPQWSDVGMWLQTIMLLLRSEGLDSCPQEYMGLYGRTIKHHLGLSDDIMLFCGLAIGKRDATSPVNEFERERVPLGDQVTFLGFEG